MAENQPRYIKSAKPFREKALEYRESGWDNPIWLPPKQKDPPPVGYTGRPDPKNNKGMDVTRLILEQWLNDPETERANLALHLGNTVIVRGHTYETLAIDVDENDDDPKKPKRGGDQLKQLEEKLGKLPQTWMNSPRENGISGHRLFLVPAGYEWRQNCAELGAPHIDIISKCHKYSIVYPSHHPKGGQYLWYPPGVLPTGVKALVAVDWKTVGSGYNPAARGDICAIPKAIDLPILTDPWIDCLSRNRIPFEEARPIDMDTPLSELAFWAETTFIDPLGESCPAIRNALRKRLNKIENGSEHHFPLTDGHWNLYRLASEGHSGWFNAIEEMEKAWMNRVVLEGRSSNRSQGQAKREMSRSRGGALRKIKGLCDDNAAKGYSVAASVETCFIPDDLVTTAAEDFEDDQPPHWTDNVTIDKQEPPESYESLDDSMAKFFIDTFGSSVRFLGDVGKGVWVIYDGMIWRIDNYNNVHHLFTRGCMAPMKKRYKHLLDAIENMNDGPEKDRLKSQAGTCKKIYETYSNQPKQITALRKASQTPGYAISYTDLNHDRYIIAMPNGKIIRLLKRTRNQKENEESEGFVIEDNKREYYTTKVTKLSYVSLEDMKKDEDLARKVENWEKTLEIFLPNVSYQKFVRRVFGHCLIGGNPAKRMIFLYGKPDTGKSTFLNSLGVLGEYAAPFDPSNVLEDKKGAPNPELGDHFYHRVVHASEVGRARIDANMLKRVAGRDKLTTRFLWANRQITGLADFTMFLATNQPPKILGEDKATQNRILALPFNETVDKIDQDENATEKIVEECGEAILLWMLMGHRDYVREGLREETWHPSAVEATREFITQLSDIGSFLAEVCEIAPDELRAKYTRLSNSAEEEEELKEWRQVMCKDLFEHHKLWLGEGEKHWGRGAFNNYIRGLGLMMGNGRVGNRTGQVWFGLKMKSNKIPGKSDLPRTFN
jgi:Zierdtviridae DNA primase